MYYVYGLTKDFDMRTHWLIMALLLSTPCFASTSPATQTEVVQALQYQGLPNLYQITPLLYRSAQPTADGMQQAEKLGISTVVNLRSFHRDTKLLQGTQLMGIHIPMHAWNVSDDDEAQLIDALRILAHSKTPVLVHCQHGADRTGVVIAMYRIVIQGWSKEQAIQEMTSDKFGYHSVWKNIVRYIRKADIDKLRKAVLSKAAS